MPFSETGKVKLLNPFSTKGANHHREADVSPGGMPPAIGPFCFSQGQPPLGTVSSTLLFRELVAQPFIAEEQTRKTGISGAVDLGEGYGFESVWSYPPPERA